MHHQAFLKLKEIKTLEEYTQIISEVQNMYKEFEKSERFVNIE